MQIPPIGPNPIAPVGGAASASAPAAGFGDTVGKALESVSAAENQADALAQRLAAGEDVGIHELMVATSKAQLSVEVLVQVRNKAVEAYQEIMRMQV